MKIGVVAQYLDSRNDIRELIEWLSKENEIILYVRSNDLKTSIPGVAVQEIKARRKTLKNFLLERLFFLFGKIPKSRNNYYITESFKINNTKTSRIFKTEKKWLLAASRYLPKNISYDMYLDQIDYSTDTKIDDIDTFLCFTEIYDDFLFAHLIHSQKKLFVYVYSWDHPCKMVRFSKRVHQYLVWNEGLKEDMVKLQEIKARSIEILGSSQLAYIAEYRQTADKSVKPFDFDYLYFGCATGNKELVKQEVAIIHQIAQMLLEHFPELKLVVRPYPFLALWEVYTSLRAYPNVVLDNEYRGADNSFALSKERIYEKFTKISYAKAFIHLGTTMGLEATYFDAPVLHGNFEMERTGNISMYDFIHQYQNDKYLKLDQYPNVINSVADLSATLPQLLADPESFLSYNQYVRQQTALHTFPKVAHLIADRLSDELTLAKKN